jgi:hypothetical protein
MKYGICVGKIDRASRSYDESMRVEHLVFLQQFRVFGLHCRSSRRVNGF